MATMFTPTQNSLLNGEIRYQEVYNPQGTISREMHDALVVQGLSRPFQTIDEVEKVMLEGDQLELLSRQGWKFDEEDDNSELNVHYDVSSPWGAVSIQKFGKRASWDNVEPAPSELVYFRSTDWRKWTNIRTESIEKYVASQRVRMFEQNEGLPDATVRGLEGIKIADFVLKSRGARGILLGSLAKEIWRDTGEPLSWLGHRDTDVLILDFHCEQHPGMREGGVDWWISHFILERPRNSFASALTANFLLQTWLKKSFPPGLYLPPRPLVQEWNEKESHLIQTGAKIKVFPVKQKPRLKDFPVIPRRYLHVQWLSSSDPIASTCGYIPGKV